MSLVAATPTTTTTTTPSYPKCRCTTSDDKIVVAEPCTVKWCKFLSNMLEGVGAISANDSDCTNDVCDDQTDAIVMCDSNMFNFVNQFCKFYEDAPYEYVLLNEVDEHGNITRAADIAKGRPVVKFAPLYEMARNACTSDNKRYDKRKAAWKWFSKALDAAEYFECEPLITEVNRAIAYILTGMDNQALQKITDIDPAVWARAANELLQERNNKSNPKLNHTEIFDAIYRTLAPADDTIDNVDDTDNNAIVADNLG